MFQDTVKEMLKLAQNYDKALEEEDKMTPEQLAIKNVGKQDPKRHLEDKVDVLMTTNIVQVRTSGKASVVSTNSRESWTNITFQESKKTNMLHECLIFPTFLA